MVLSCWIFILRVIKTNMQRMVDERNALHNYERRRNAHHAKYNTAHAISICLAKHEVAHTSANSLSIPDKVIFIKIPSKRRKPPVRYLNTCFLFATRNAAELAI